MRRCIPPSARSKLWYAKSFHALLIAGDALAGALVGCRTSWKPVMSSIMANRLEARLAPLVANATQSRQKRLQHRKQHMGICRRTQLSRPSLGPARREFHRSSSELHYRSSFAAEAAANASWPAVDARNIVTDDRVRSGWLALSLLASVSWAGGNPESLSRRPKLSMVMVCRGQGRNECAVLRTARTSAVCLCAKATRRQLATSRRDVKKVLKDAELDYAFRGSHARSAIHG